jgi:CopG family nickel-responsive transcriptional regulator
MLERFSATVEADLLAKFDRYLGRHGYGNRSEGVRDLIRKALVADEWQNGREEVMGVISLVYDHHQPNLLAHMTGIQHDSEALIISTTHIHMDHRNCLEIIAARGKAAKNGSLSASTTGRRL